MTNLAQYPFEPNFLDIRGHRLAYLDEGEGLPLVMVHGNPSWSYLYRNLVTQLRDRYRCIVPDHIGCGFSDKPQHYPYRLENHIQNLEFLLDHLEVKRCVLLVHDWGGAIGMGWAGRYPERVAGCVVMNTAAFPSPHIPLRIDICRWPFLGEFLVRGLNGFAGSAIFMAVKKRMPLAVARSFLAPYNNWHNRIAVHRFVKDIPMHPSHPSWPTLIAIEKNLSQLSSHPMLLCWGGGDFCFHDWFFEQWQARFPQAEPHYFQDAGHYLLEDAFEQIAPRIEDFLTGLPLPRREI
ncbi:alpha/beta fold hydrolase [Desulfobulbus rhabdoformis]|nr:alpha/beta fold hydrolase [Desulfobulbus rhabdoformis]